MLKILLTVLLLFNTVFAKEILLTDKNTAYLNDQVNPESMVELIKKVQELNRLDTNDPIYLVLNSPGGSVYAGIEFIRFAQKSRRSIDTITVFSASMSFQISQALGIRYVAPFSVMMSHRMSGGVEGSFPGSLENRLSITVAHSLEIDEATVKRTNGKQTLESYRRLIADEYWANGQKSINDGFADEEVTFSCDKSLDTTTSKIIERGPYALNVEFSNCPLISMPISISLARGEDFVQESGVDFKKEFLSKRTHL